MNMQVLATDGTSIRRLLWISRTAEGIETGYCMPGSDVHITYHTDGKKWITRNGAKVQVSQGPPLSQIKGKIQLFTYVFRSDDFEAIKALHPPYREKSWDALFLVDVRMFHIWGALGCEVCILEPHQVHDLIGLPLKPIGHIFTDEEPWIGLMLNPVATGVSPILRDRSPPRDVMAKRG